MKQELITEVMQQMLLYLDNAQLKQLKQVMEQTLFHYEVTGAKVKPEEDNSNDLIAMFIAAKRIEGFLTRQKCPPYSHGGSANIPYRVPEQESVEPGHD